MISHLFKLPRHRTFDYTPRHFDPIKEEFKKKMKQKQGLNLDKDIIDNMDVPIKERMTIRGNYISRKYADKKEDRVRLYIRLVTIALLLMVVYMVLDVSVKMF